MLLESLLRLIFNQQRRRVASLWRTMLADLEVRWDIHVHLRTGFNCRGCWRWPPSTSYLSAVVRLLLHLISKLLALQQCPGPAHPFVGASPLPTAPLHVGIRREFCSIAPPSVETDNPKKCRIIRKSNYLIIQWLNYSANYCLPVARLGKLFPSIDKVHKNM